MVSPFEFLSSYQSGQGFGLQIIPSQHERFDHIHCISLLSFVYPSSSLSGDSLCGKPKVYIGEFGRVGFNFFYLASYFT